MILVTGATGRSGAAIVHELARQGVPAKALVRDRTRAEALGLHALPSIQIVVGDMLRRETLEEAFHDVDRALMISGAREHLVETQGAFVDAAKAAGVCHIVKFSGAESGEGFDPLAFSGTRNHEIAEAYLRASGLAWTILRPSQFMHMYLIEPPSVQATGALIRPMGEATLSPIDTNDVAKVAVAILRRGGFENESFDLTGPEALSMAEMAERFSRVLAKEVRYQDVTLDAYAAFLSKAATPPAFLKILLEVYAERRKHRSRVVLAAHHRFGVHPTTFEEFLEQNSEAFRGQR